MRPVNSASGIDSQIPVSPKSFGSTSTNPMVKIKLLKTDIRAEILPLPIAVKKLDAKIENPLIRKTKAKNSIPFVAKAKT